MKKLTNVSALEMVLSLQEVQANVELVEKLTVMKNQFDKKNHSGLGKPTKTQIANQGIKEIILEVLSSCDSPKAIKELQSLDDRIGVATYSGQKISALVKQLVVTGEVVRTEVKGTALFEIRK